MSSLMNGKPFKSEYGVQVRIYQPVIGLEEALQQNQLQ